MKNQWQKRIAYAVLMLILMMITWACNNNFLSDDQKYSPDEAPPSGLMEVNFEAEVLSYEELADAKSATIMEKINAMPHALRSKISIQIYDDGTSDWRIEKLKPKHDVIPKHLTPPNPDPQTKVTRINRMGMGYFYDEKGKLLKEHAVPVQSFSDLIIKVKKNPDAIFSTMGLKTIGNIESYLSDAKSKGAIIQNVGKNRISISSTLTQTVPNARISNEKNEDYTVVDIIDKKINMVARSTIYDKSKGSLVSESNYLYKLNNENRVIPSAIFAYHYSEDSKGKKHKTISNTYFDGVSGTINIK